MATWKLVFGQALAGNLADVFPSSMDFTPDENSNSFSYIIRVKENNNPNPVDRTFTCTWQGSTRDDLVLACDTATNHYYRGRIHKRTISRGGPNNPIVSTIMVGMLGHSPTPYSRNGVGNEDNVVIFTGTTP